MRRNFFLTIIVILCMHVASAQTVRLGASAGATMSKFFEKERDEKIKGNFRPGFTIGIMLDVPMEKHGSFQPAIHYMQKGGKKEVDDGTDKISSNVTLNYIEVPLNVVFRIPGGGGNFIVGGGPSFGLGLSGKAKTDINGTKEDSDVKFGSNQEDDDFNYVDFGINALAGYEFTNGFFVAASYTHGINNLLIDALETDKLYNRVFALRVGFLLKGKVKK